MSAPLVVALDGGGVAPALLGGKGAWLDRLVGAGFCVPPVAVLTTAVYHSVESESPEIAALVERLRSAELPATGGFWSAQAEVDEVFARAALPAGVGEAIAEAAALAGGGRLVARSSATAEDLHDASFAGQYRSVIDVAPGPELEAAVRAVWASLWHPAPRAYRRHRGVDEAHIGMAVVVMPLVASREAGVAFSRDPTDATGPVRVERVQGQGEQLVSGRVTPTVDRLPRPGGLVDGTGHDALACEVAGLAVAVERSLGEPQDIEWAWDGISLWLLQARPITAAAVDDGLESVVPEHHVCTTAGVVEMLPGVLPPLVWQVNAFVVEEGFRRLYDSLAPLPADLGPLLVRCRGRAAVDLANLSAATRGLDGEELTPPRRRRWRTARRDLAALRERRRAAREASLVVAAVTEVVRTTNSLELGSLDDEVLLRLRRRLIDMASRTMAAEIATATAAVDSYQSLERSLVGRLGANEAARQAQRLVAGALAGTDLPLERLERLAHRASKVPVVVEALSAPTWPDARRELTRSAPGRELLRELRSWFDSVGSRAALAGPRWDEDPTIAWAVLRAHLEVAAPPARAPDAFSALADHLRAQPGWQRTRVLTGQVVDVRLHALSRQAGDACELLARREAVKAAGLALGGLVRLVHLELGRRMVTRGSLHHALDVDLLLDGELVGALHGSPPAPAELGRRRSWMVSCEAAGPLPTRFRGRAVPVGEAVIGTNELRGWGASPGSRRGRCRVMSSVDDGGFEAGDVLVARSTDASWTPLFLVAGALVIEEGGPLSHAAIVARELAIPAVVNVPGALAALHDGDEVTVDGDSGVVSVHMRAVAAEGQVEPCR